VGAKLDICFFFQVLVDFFSIIGVSTTAYQDRVEHEVIIKALIKHKLKKNLPVLEKKSRYLI
jgi:hypothetical protein